MQVSCAKKVCFSLGLLGIILGGITIGVYPFLYDAILESQLIIEEGSTSYEMWESLPIPMYMKLYFFNITNVDELLPGSKVKPKLVECGPYTFKEDHRKVNISWNDEESTVDFQQIKTWHFLPELSSGSLDDEITTLNVIAMAAVEYARYEPNLFYMYAIDGFLNLTDSKLFMTHKVRNMTFDGIVDRVLEEAATSGISLPIPFDRFGWFYPRNESAEYDSWFSMFTGKSDFTKVGQIAKWNNSDRIREDIYVDHCGMLNGSAGEFFPSKRDKTFVDFFTPDLCRSIRFQFSEETEVVGVDAFKYILDERMVANATTCEDNKCFNFRADEEQPVPNGLLNVSSCKFNAPAFVSYPHFYLADDFYLQQFEDGSLNPDPEKHQSHLSLEPVSGVPMDVRIRMQINVLARPLIKEPFEITMLRDREPTFYPMVWFETYTELDDETATLLKFLGVAPKLGKIIGGSMIGLGGLILAVVVILIFVASRQKIKV